jgi:hypothetical protein
MTSMHLRLTILFLSSFLVSFHLLGQTWNFIKEKDGVKLYTRKDDGKTLKSYKGVADIHAPASKVFAMIEDVYHTEWWDKSVSEIRVLKYEKNRMAQYYIRYDLPWPWTDRDLCVDVKTTYNPATGEGTVAAGPLNGLIPENKELVRIKEYHQTWTVQPAGPDLSHVTLEGYADPAGTIPDWVTNMIIVNSPIQSMTNIRLALEKK